MTISAARNVLWQAIRLPVFALLAILEPVVRFLLCGLALLLVLCALFFEFFTELPNFPFWEMLAAGVGCGLLMMAYYAVMRLFSR